jgi:beta-galactosidase
MVRLWSWEAFAHGAEAVCYFRWRQAPMAQEQMHAGLLRPDSADAPALAEARQVAQEIANAPAVSISQAPVAIIFDYNSDFAWSVQPHGKGLNYFSLVFQVYRALRSLGLSIDILPPSTRDFTGYKMVFVPGMIHVAGDLIDALASADARVIYGPRTAARGEHLTIPTPLPPRMTGLDVTVSYVESLRPSLSLELKNGGQVTGYFEHLETSAVIEEQTTTGCPAVVAQGHQVYVAGWFDHTGWRALIKRQAAGAGLSVIDLPDGLRCRDTRTERFWINYDTQDHNINGKCVPAASYLREDLETPVTR